MATKYGKMLLAGMLGVLLGDAVQQAIGFTAWPSWATYLIGAYVGSLLNFATQVKVKNIDVKRA